MSTYSFYRTIWKTYNCYYHIYKHVFSPIHVFLESTYYRKLSLSDPQSSSQLLLRYRFKPTLTVYDHTQSSKRNSRNESNVGLSHL